MLTVDRTIEKEVIRIISKTKKIKAERLQASARLEKDFGFDEVDVVDIILQLEKNFKIVIPDEVPMQTVRDVVGAVEAYTMRKVG
jgi:acyl carrier protein